MTARTHEMTAPAAGGLRLPVPPSAAPFLGCLALALALALAGGIPGPGTLHPYLLNDSAMRLVSVRDLLAGQGWLDPVQARLGIGGLEMHWSRLVDAPLAGIVLLLDPALGRTGAEHAALVLWPILMLAAGGAAAHSIGAVLAGPRAGFVAAICFILALGPDTRYGPGDIDHHSPQLLLLLLALRGGLGTGWRWPAAGGLALAASLAIGVESLPILAALGLAIALRWAWTGEAAREGARAFGAGLAGGLALLFPLTVPAAAWRGGFCDALSIDLALPVAAGALLLAGLAQGASDAARARRAALLIGGGGLTAALTVLALPACLSNPYDALHPMLVENWLSLVGEARPITDVLTGRLQIGTGFLFAIGAIGIAAGLAARALGLLPARVLLPVLLGAVALAMTALQVRSGLYAAALAAILLGTIAGALAARARPGRAIRPLLLAAGCAAISLPGLWVGLHERLSPHAAASAPPARCAGPGAWDGLAARPSGMVASGVDLGAAILLATHHAALAAPYHRNEAGLLAQMRIAFAPDADAARAGMAAAGARYVALCAGSSEQRAHAAHGRTGFFADLEAGRVPGWLVPVPMGEGTDLRVFALR